MKPISTFRRLRLAFKSVYLSLAIRRYRRETYECILEAPPYGMGVDFADEAFFEIWRFNIKDIIDRNMATARYWAETNPTMVHDEMTDWQILTYDPHYISAIFDKNRELNDRLELYTQIHLDAIASELKARVRHKPWHHLLPG